MYVSFLVQWERERAFITKKTDAANGRTDGGYYPTLTRSMSSTSGSQSRRAFISARGDTSGEARDSRPTLQGGMPGKGESAPMALLSCFSLYRNIPILLAPSRKGEDAIEVMYWPNGNPIDQITHLIMPIVLAILCVSQAPTASSMVFRSSGECLHRRST